MSSSTDLATALVHPDGFGPASQDHLSGPIATADDVARIFTDVPGQADQIMRNGFVRGYIQNWQKAQPTTPIFTVPPTVLATEIVLQFETDNGASAMNESFRRAALAQGFTPFAAPSQLPHVYGVSQEQRLTSYTTYYQGIAWTRGPFLYSVALTSSDPQAGTNDIVTLALHQDETGSRR
jgi:hypothetical protein